MPIHNNAEGRAEMKRIWAKARSMAKAKHRSSARTTVVDHTRTRKQVAIRAQRAAGEALEALRRRQSGEGD